MSPANRPADRCWLAATRRATPSSHGRASSGTSPIRRQATANVSATASSASASLRLRRRAYARTRRWYASKMASKRAEAEASGADMPGRRGAVRSGSLPRDVGPPRPVWRTDLLRRDAPWTPLPTTAGHAANVGWNTPGEYLLKPRCPPQAHANTVPQAEGLAVIDEGMRRWYESCSWRNSSGICNLTGRTASSRRLRWVTA